jgi:isocitrate dehydrogenase
LELANLIRKAAGNRLDLEMMSNRGTKVWPDGAPETFCTDAYRCRFIDKNGVTPQELVALLGRVNDLGLEIAMTESLRTYDGKPGFTLAQGQ